MNTEWQVKPLSRKSSLTGQSFTPGAKVTSYIYSNPEQANELLRTDVLEEESANFEIPQNLILIARWTRLVKDREDDEQRQSQKQRLNNAEELFLSLYNEDNEGGATQKTRSILKQLLGLMLERKRILRRINSTAKDVILYLHVSTKNSYEIPQIPLDLKEIEKVQGQLTALIE